MMKPKIDDVIEYVKAGEDDRQMEKMLDLHPDGQEILKQARFVCRMLQNQSESKDDGGHAASFDSIAGRSDRVADMPLMASLRKARGSRTYYQEAIQQRRVKRSPSLRDMVDGGGGRSEDLGTLELATEGEQVTLSYEPSEAVTRRTHKPRLSKAARQMDFEGIPIHGLGYTVTVPDKLADDEPITIRVHQNISNLPVRQLALIYMPDSGPFVRIETNSEGKAELPVPEQSGTLRIESGIPQLLHIKLIQ